jgi:DNA-binding NtrC family response regulator
MKKILWIDDNEKLINSSVQVFYNYGFSIVKAINTSHALSILREEKINGVLLDVRLGGGESGLELLEEIHRLYPSLKVAIFTGYPEYDDHIIAEKKGASVYISKINKSIPFNPEKQKQFFKSLDEIFTDKLPQNEIIKRKKIVKKLFAIGLFIMGTFIGIVANIATDELPAFIKPFLWISWPILLTLLIISIILIIKQE